MLDLETKFLLFRHATPDESYDDGEVVFEEGQVADSMYVVKSGRVDVQLGGEVVDAVTEGGMFGEMALIDETVRSARAVAVGPTVLVPIGLQRFRFLVQASPDFSLAVMRALTDRQRAADRRLISGGSPERAS